MCSKCFAAHYPTAPLAVASTGSPIGSPKSLSKRANSAHHENGQRLAGYVGISETGFLMVPLTSRKDRVSKSEHQFVLLCLFRQLPHGRANQQLKSHPCGDLK